MGKMRPLVKRALFFFVYITLVLLPGLVMLFSGKLRGPDYIVKDLAVFLGYTGLSMAGIQLIAVGKIRWLADAFNMDKVYNNHHWLSLASTFMIFAHVILLVFDNAKVARFLLMFGQPWKFAAGVIGLLGFILIGITSVARRQLRLDYRVWLYVHDILSAILLTFGIIHLIKVDYYTQFPLMKAVWIFLIVLYLGMIIHIRILKAFFLRKIPYKVESVIRENETVYTLNLLPDGHKGESFRAGQVAWISAGDNPYVLSRNPFSYSGSDMAPGGAIRFSIKEVGDFTSSIKDLKVGDRMYIDGPYGRFNLDAPKTQKGLVLIGGGIGVAPVIGMVESLRAAEDKRPIYVFYGDYSERTVLYADDFAKAGEVLDLHMINVLENPMDDDYPYKGYITAEIMRKVLPENYKEFLYFVCGPAPMLRAIERNFKQLGIPMSQVQEENYTMA